MTSCKTRSKTWKIRKNSLETKYANDVITLKTKLGIDSDAVPDYAYPALDEASFSALMSGIDHDADFEKLMQNSVNIKALQITYDSMSSHNYATDSQAQGAKLSLDASKSNTGSGFELLFNSLTGQYSDLQNSYRSLAVEKDKLDKAQAQFDRGFISALALSNVQLEYLSAQTAVEVKESVLYGTYLTYCNMVAGN